MKDNESKPNNKSVVIIGFVAGVLTVLIIIFAMRKC